MVLTALMAKPLSVPSARPANDWTLRDCVWQSTAEENPPPLQNEGVPQFFYCARTHKNAQKVCTISTE